MPNRATSTLHAEGSNDSPIYQIRHPDAVVLTIPLGYRCIVRKLYVISFMHGFNFVKRGSCHLGSAHLHNNVVTHLIIFWECAYLGACP